MKCPHDAADLAPFTYEAAIEVDQCPKCRGIWLDKGELEAIQETVEHNYAEEIRKMPDTALTQYKDARNARVDETLKCPKCLSELHTREHGYCSQIYVDVCPGCQGVWLDDGELQALEVFFERSQLDTPTIRKSFWTSLKDLFIHGIVPED